LTNEYEERKVPASRTRIREAAILQYSADRQDDAVMSTISSKNQITLPAHLLREMGIGAGDRLAVTLEGNRLVLRPRPKNWVKYYGGSLKGLYGNTPEETAAYLAELRAEGDREFEGDDAGPGPAADS
jgi:AbrB family looped-hinge helix DNA binding protein